MNPYLSYDRKAWAELRNSVPMTLTPEDLINIQGINDRLSMEEVTEIYLPLSRLLNLYVEARQSRNQVLDQFFNTSDKAKKSSPFIIGIAGSVAVGKSTTARLLKTLLSRWESHPKVELVTTDGFLRPNEELNRLGIMTKKGFPESYNTRRLIQFLKDVKAGHRHVSAPVYSHITYDITEEKQIVDQPDVLIIEGLNVLQNDADYPKSSQSLFISDFLDFSIYVDAEIPQLEEWYISRFLKLLEGAFTDENSYFHHFTQLSTQEAIETANSIWQSINQLNLIQNILPTRERAQLILKKGKDHKVESVRLRK